MGASKRIHSEYFFIQYKPSTNKVSKFTVVISKKVEKAAVKRNKIKRRIREIIKNELYPFKKPLFMVIHVKKGIGDLNFNKYKIELQNLLVNETSVTQNEQSEFCVTE